jgi:hypothetical protein
MNPLPSAQLHFQPQEVQQMLDLPPSAHFMIGKTMTRQEFDSTMPHLALTAAQVRHGTVDIGNKNKSSFAQAVYNLYETFEGCRYFSNLSKAIQFDFLDKDGEILTKPQWMEFNDPMTDPLDGHGIYLYETHGSELSSEDPINK